mgnify:CR=1 FL=1
MIDNKYLNVLVQRVISLPINCIQIYYYRLEEKKRSASMANHSYKNISKMMPKEDKKCFSVNLEFLENLTIENPTV